MARRITYDGPGEFKLPIGEPKKRIHIVPPGTWFHCLTLVLMTPTWLPWAAKLLGMKKLAKLATPGCGKCNSRKNSMDRAGWKGLPRLFARSEFWSKNKVGWIWSKNQTTPT